MVQKKDLKVHEDTIKNASRCKKNYSCLSGGNLCKVDMCVEDKILFIVCVNGETCNYRVPFGYSYVCTCPVRKELYNLYKL